MESVENLTSLCGNLNNYSRYLETNQKFRKSIWKNLSIHLYHNMSKMAYKTLRDTNEIQTFQNYPHFFLEKCALFEAELLKDIIENIFKKQNYMFVVPNLCLYSI